MSEHDTQVIEQPYEPPAVEELATDGPATVCGIVAQTPPA